MFVFDVLAPCGRTTFRNVAKHTADRVCVAGERSTEALVLCSAYGQENRTSHVRVRTVGRAHNGGVHQACTLPTLRPHRCDVESMTKCNGQHAGKRKLCSHPSQVRGCAGTEYIVLPRHLHFEPSSLHWLVHQFPIQPSTVHTVSRLGEDYPATGFTRSSRKSEDVILLLWTTSLEVAIGTGCLTWAPPSRSSRLLVAVVQRSAQKGTLIARATLAFHRVHHGMMKHCIKCGIVCT